jgi:hypothetical protein
MDNRTAQFLLLGYGMRKVAFTNFSRDDPSTKIYPLGLIHTPVIPYLTGTYFVSLICAYDNRDSINLARWQVSFTY